MANENKHVVIAYFSSKAQAEQTAERIKEWDKGNDDIKLGGIGILTADKGKIKTRKVGRRAGGTGAKWGLALGAVTGILSGGVTLIGGAVAGSASGAVLGALFHKSLGLSDADKARLEQHLQSAGAALVVMADEHEVTPTKAELVALGGQAEDYTLPEETISQVEESVEVAPVEGEAADHIDERVPVAEEEIPEITGLNGGLRTIEGIGPAHSAALAGIGITSKRVLLERGATPEGRAEIAEQSQISEKLIDKWVSTVDLQRVTGVGPRYGKLLQAAGVTTVGALAQQEAVELHTQLVALNAESDLVHEVAGVSRVAGWIGKAKELPQLVTDEPSP